MRTHPYTLFRDGPAIGFQGMAAAPSASNLATVSQNESTQHPNITPPESPAFLSWRSSQEPSPVASASSLFISMPSVREMDRLSLDSAHFSQGSTEWTSLASTNHPNLPAPTSPHGAWDAELLNLTHLSLNRASHLMTAAADQGRLSIGSTPSSPSIRSKSASTVRHTPSPNERAQTTSNPPPTCTNPVSPAATLRSSSEVIASAPEAEKCLHPKLSPASARDSDIGQLRNQILELQLDLGRMREKAYQEELRRERLLASLITQYYRHHQLPSLPSAANLKPLLLDVIAAYEARMADSLAVLPISATTQTPQPCCCAPSNAELEQLRRENEALQLQLHAYHQPAFKLRSLSRANPDPYATKSQLTTQFIRQDKLHWKYQLWKVDDLDDETCRHLIKEFMLLFKVNDPRHLISWLNLRRHKQETRANHRTSAQRANRTERKGVDSY
ncbi:hypothetical protein H4R34_000870 [Dimargaris verticillata]|uniref:Uncharacterized protein n=1 Tax=Dimargaris verticillata TaxID=2761393 RepID=A0A9W8B4M2_9FUNG|nr:hypothetical protein H4R34_000870 [Dimargaris verticillata]